MSDKTGGPAFPTPEHRDHNGDIVEYAESGMTLRDYFAAKAMQGFCGNDWPVHCDESVSRLASFAYMMAGAMIAAREK